MPLDPNEPIPDQFISPLEPAEPTLPPPTPAVHRGEDPVFNLWDVLFILIAAVISLFVASALGLAVFFATHPSAPSREFASDVPFLLVTQLVAYILTVGFMVFLIWQKYRVSFLRAVKWNMPVGARVFGAFMAGAVLAVATQTASYLLRAWIPKSLPIEQYFRTTSSAYALMVFGILVAPFVEELFFRGFLFPALARPLEIFFRGFLFPTLAKVLGLACATILTAAGFAMIHSGQLAHAWIPLLLLFIVGTVFTLARAWTQSVAVSVLMHIAYNTTLFSALYFATQGFRHMERG